MNTLTSTSLLNEQIGVLALQGGFAKHLDSLASLGIKGIEVRSVDDLGKIDRLIIPGGESTTVGLLMQKFGLAPAIQELAVAGMPMWGTCMGMILMAREIEDRPNQFSLGILDIKISRNAFGSQVHSFEDSVYFEEFDESVLGVFIRAPVVKSCGADVKVLGSYRSQTVAVQQGRRLGTSFHPELTENTRLHEYFLQI